MVDSIGMAFFCHTYRPISNIQCSATTTRLQLTRGRAGVRLYGPRRLRVDDDDDECSIVKHFFFVLGLVVFFYKPICSAYFNLFIFTCCSPVTRHRISPLDDVRKVYTGK